MAYRSYLPSPQFSLIVFSILVSGGLIFGAEQFTASGQTATIASVPPGTTASTAAANTMNWQAALASIQVEEGSSSLPAAPNESLVDSLLQSAQTPNLTQTLGRTLLINLSDAQSQGMGADTPTQTAIVTQALSQIAPPSPNITYTQSDLNVVVDSPSAERAYGNAVILVLEDHPRASIGNTLSIIGAEVNGDPSQLPQLAAIGKDYQALAKDLANVPVPESLASYHLELINDFEQMGESYAAMEAIQSDPARGLLGLQQYNSLESDVQGMFINITQSFAKDDIIFGEDDPGAQWASILSTQ